MLENSEGQEKESRGEKTCRVDECNDKYFRHMLGNSHLPRASKYPSGYEM